jgi:hypothetical protein
VTISRTVTSKVYRDREKKRPHAYAFQLLIKAWVLLCCIEKREERILPTDNRLRILLYSLEVRGGDRIGGGVIHLSPELVILVENI